MSTWSSSPSSSLPYRLHSYVTEDKFYCVYLAPEQEDERQRPDRVAEVRRLIHPANPGRRLPAPPGSSG